MNLSNSVREPRSFFRAVVVVAAICVILAAMHAAAWIVNLVLLAFLIAMLALPVMRWLRGRGLSAGLSFLAVLALIIGVTVVIGLMALLAIANAATTVQQDMARFQEQSASLAAAAEAAGLEVGALQQTADTAAEDVLGVVVTVAANSISLIVNVVFVLLIAAFMLAEAETFSALLKRTVGADNPAYLRVSESTSSVITYITITAIINFVIAVGDVILLTAVGVPNALLWGLVSFVFGFIPYIGYWISFLPPFFLAFAVGGLPSALVVLIGYALINGVVSQIVAPRMYGTSLNLSITLTVIVVLFWGWLLGPVGGILAVPLTAILKSAVLANFAETEWLATILGNSRGEMKKNNS